jgi:anti-anti-sigma factor
MALPHSAPQPLRRHPGCPLVPPTGLVTVGTDEAAGTVTVVISGELDVTITPSLAELLARVLDRKPQRLVFDLAQVDFIDCAAARLIVDMGRSLPAGRRVVIRRPGPAVRRILELTRLDAHCQVE